MNLETEYFSSEVLQQIEELTMSNSRCKEKDRAFLVDLMTELETKRFLSVKQKFQVHRIVELYYPNAQWEPAATLCDSEILFTDSYGGEMNR